jgi:hypothetical protein
MPTGLSEPIGTHPFRPHIGNSSILDPNGLAFDKLFGKSIEERPIDENGIRGHSPK